MCKMNNDFEHISNMNILKFYLEFRDRKSILFVESTNSNKYIVYSSNEKKKVRVYAHPFGLPISLGILWQKIDKFWQDSLFVSHIHTDENKY